MSSIWSEKGWIKRPPSLSTLSSLWKSFTSEQKVDTLYFAARGGHVDLLKFALNQGVDVNSTCAHAADSTPLHGACWGRHLTCVKLLVLAGADPLIRNKYSETAADNAKAKDVLGTLEEVQLKLLLEETHAAKTPPLVQPFGRAHFKMNLGPVSVTERVSLKPKQHEKLTKLHDVYASYSKSPSNRWKARMLSNRCHGDQDYVMERLLTMLIQTKWNHKKAVEQLEEYLESSKLFEQWVGITALDLQSECLLTSGEMVFGGVDKDATRSIIVMPALHTITKDGGKNFLNIKAALFMVSLALKDQYERGEFQHILLVIDLAGASIRNHVDLNLLREIISTIERFFPMAVKGVIIMDANSFIKNKVKRLGLAMPAPAYVKSRQISKKLLDHFHRAELPIQYGGTRPDILCPAMVDLLREVRPVSDVGDRSAVPSLSLPAHRAGHTRRRSHDITKDTGGALMKEQAGRSPSSTEAGETPLYAVGPYLDIESTFAETPESLLACEKGENLQLLAYAHEHGSKSVKHGKRVMIVVCRHETTSVRRNEGRLLKPMSKTKFTTGAAQGLSREDIAAYKARAMMKYMEDESPLAGSRGSSGIALLGSSMRSKSARVHKSGSKGKLFTNQMMAGAARAAAEGINIPSHPNVLKMRGAVFATNKAFLIFDLGGKQLRQVLEHANKNGKELPWKEKLTIAQNVANALKHLHKHDIVLKTLSTWGVWVNADGTARVGEVVLDGVLDALELRTARFRAITWMAPEILDSNEAIAPSADVYSLGLLLVALLTGTDPYACSSQSEADRSVTQILEGYRPVIPEHAGDAYTALVKWCWKPRPRDRPTVKKVRRSLERIRTKGSKRGGFKKDCARASPPPPPSSAALGGADGSLEDFMTSLGLERFIDALAAHQVTRTSLALMDQADLAAMGLPLGPQKTVLAAVHPPQAQACRHEASTGRHRQLSRLGGVRRAPLEAHGRLISVERSTAPQEAPVGTRIARARAPTIGGQASAMVGARPLRGVSSVPFGKRGDSVSDLLARWKEEAARGRDNSREGSTAAVGAILEASSKQLETLTLNEQQSPPSVARRLEEPSSPHISTSSTNNNTNNSNNSNGTGGGACGAPSDVHRRGMARRPSHPLARIGSRKRWNSTASANDLLSMKREKPSSLPSPRSAPDNIKEAYARSASDAPIPGGGAKGNKEEEERHVKGEIAREMKETENAQTTGVYGETTGVYGETAGVYGDTAGLYGETTGVYGETAGVYGETAGVYGETTGVYGETAGVYGETAGVYSETGGASHIFADDGGSSDGERSSHDSSLAKESPEDAYRSSSAASSSSSDGEHSQDWEGEVFESEAPLDASQQHTTTLRYRKLAGKAGTIQQRMRERETDFGIQRIYMEDVDMNPIPLAAGGFGTVFKGTWKGLSVAIKLLHHGASSARKRQEFVQEALLMHHIGCHRNIVALYGVILDEFEWYMVTELAERGSVYDALIRDQPNIPLELVLRIARDTAEGLVYLHANGVIHRDMAARNVLLSRNYEVLLTDFGLSRAMENDVGQTFSKVGPIKWMAPEAIMRQEYSPATDTWSYGVFLWELATQEAEGPYQGRMLLDVAAGVGAHKMRLSPPSPCHFVLKDIMERCWEWSPRERCTMLQARDAFASAYDDICETTGSYGLFL